MIVKNYADWIDCYELKKCYPLTNISQLNCNIYLFFKIAENL